MRGNWNVLPVTSWWWCHLVVAWSWSTHVTHQELLRCWGETGRQFQSYFWPQLAISASCFQLELKFFFNDSSVTHNLPLVTFHLMYYSTSMSLFFHVFFSLVCCCTQGNAQVQQSCLTSVRGSSCQHLLITGSNNSASCSCNFPLRNARVWLPRAQLCRDTAMKCTQESLDAASEGRQGSLHSCYLLNRA